MKTEIYPHAPVRQAVLDIRVRGLTDTPIPALEVASDEAYPEIFQRPMQVQFHVEGTIGNSAATAAASNTPLGYIYRSSDQKQLYQVRTDGFSHNRFAPYTEWALFSAEARRLWNVYKGALTPERIELVGLNYLNQIALPMGVDFAEYFRTYIEVPKQLPQGLSTFSMSYQIAIPNDGGFLQVSQGYAPPEKPDFANIALNIQAFKQVDLLIDDDETLWNLFEELRSAKSAAFEACITEKVRELIR